MSNKGYEPIPDVEEGLVKQGNVAPPTPKKISPQELYPQANEMEAELLGKIDDVIAHAIPKFDPPLLKVQKLSEGAAPEDIPALIASFKVPTMTFVAVVIGALTFIALDNPIALALYPYITVIMTFIGSLPALRARFTGTVVLILGQIDGTVNEVKGTIDGIAQRGLGFVEKVNTSLQKVLKPIKPKLDEATKLEKMLQKVVPGIDIPDTTDIEEELDDANDVVIGAVDTVQNAIDLMKYVPRAAQSQPLFDQYIVYPVLAFFLVSQLLGVYALQVVEADNVVKDSDSTPSPLHRFLEEVLSGTTNSGTAFEEDLETFSDQVEDQWNLIVVAFATFIGAISQIVLTYVATQKALIYGEANKKILLMSAEVSDLLTERVEPMFKKVFIDSMEKIKKQVLTLINKVAIIEGSMEKVKALQSLSLPTSIGSVKLPDVKLPDVNLPKVEMPKVEVPKVKMPKIEVPKVKMPKIEIPKVKMPKGLSGKFKKSPFG